MSNYKINKTPRGYEATLNGKLQSICLDEESALHSIWVLSGKVPSEFYTVGDDGCTVILSTV